ncbi:MAG TPA: alpha/beta fold hydrolase [Polyangiales bacterium]|nr:alpha/beta fold hydrolase [Polyangiales bacterium]
MTPKRAPRRYGFEALLRELARAPDIAAEDADLRPPRKLGRYVLGPLVARGGMGAVYRARDSELGRDVAVKLIQAKRGSQDLVRFTREVRALSTLSHPNVVAIHDAAMQQGVAFLVMELVSGETLRQLLLREQRLSLKRALALARQIAEALRAAHDCGIVHRDLKPENVAVMERGHVKVLDFGLAQLSALATEKTEHRATLTGAVLGTPHYMSPEQVRGQRATARSDVFAFGAVFYELITGKRPFGAGSAAEAYARILSSEPAAPKRLSAATLRGRSLLLALRCMAKDPRDRFASGSELVDALAEVEAGKRASNAPESVRPASRRRVTRYANADGVHVAYQVIGTGPVDLCFATGFVSNLDVWWEQAPGREFFGALAARTRLIMFDKRGCGLSDRVPNQTLDERVDDMRAVLDAVGSERAVLFGDAGNTCIRFATRYPERTRALIFYGTSVRSFNANPQARDLLVGGWGTGVSLPIFAPSMVGDPLMVRWGARWERLSASPGSLLSLIDAIHDLDVSAEARELHVPTLVIHRAGDRTHPVEAGRELAALIPEARYRELEGIDHAPMIGDGASVVREVLEFIAALPD